MEGQRRACEAIRQITLQIQRAISLPGNPSDIFIGSIQPISGDNRVRVRDWLLRSIRGAHLLRL